MKSSPIPVTFRRCVVEGCPAGQECLRRIAYDAAGTDLTSFWTINPRTARPAEGRACPHFHHADPVRYARGFREAIKTIHAGEVSACLAEMLQHFSRGTYYNLRNGEHLLTPADQTLVADILLRHGAPAPIRFDAYLDGYLWD